MQGTYEDPPVLVKRQREKGKTWARAFMVVSLGRKVQGRVGRFEIGWLE